MADKIRIYLSGPIKDVDDARQRFHAAAEDLGCWCPLAQPCHADVLLEVANP